MTLDHWISEFHAAEHALARSINDGTAPGKSASLLKRSADLLDRIERFEPRTPVERRDKAFFFLRRGLSGVSVRVGGRDIDIALALLPDPDSGRHAPPDRTERADAGQTVEGLIAYVRQSAERVSLIDSDHRFVAVSDPNAAFYETRPVRMVGAHVREMVGYEVYAGRARARLDACLAGRPQEYYHGHDSGEDGEEAERVFRCDMVPVDIPGLGRFVMVYTTDVTEIARYGVQPEPAKPHLSHELP